MSLAELRHESQANYFSRQNADAAIIRDGYAELPVNSRMLRAIAESVVAGMKEITESPSIDPSLEWRTFSIDAYGKRYQQEVGLKFKNDDECKWTFQYTPGAFKPSTRLPLPLSGALSVLDRMAMEISVALSICIDKRLRSGGIHLPSGSLASRTAAGRCITRVLRYPPQLAPVLAKAHVDRSMWTVHWWASHGGLSLYQPDGQWTSIEDVSFGSAAVFPGEKYAACTRGRWGYGTPHKVNTIADTSDRYAIVSFVHPIALPEDVEWLAEHHALIEALEERLRK